MMHEEDSSTEPANQGSHQTHSKLLEENVVQLLGQDTLLTLIIQHRWCSAHDLIFRGIQVLNQKVRGHFSFPFHFNFTSLDDFKSLIFQGTV